MCSLIIIVIISTGMTVSEILNFNHYNCYGDNDYNDYNRNGDGDLVGGHVILWTNNILSDLDCEVK